MPDTQDTGLYDPYASGCMCRDCTSRRALETAQTTLPEVREAASDPLLTDEQRETLVSFLAERVMEVPQMDPQPFAARYTVPVQAPQVDPAPVGEFSYADIVDDYEDPWYARQRERRERLRQAAEEARARVENGVIQLECADCGLDAYSDEDQFFARGNGTFSPSCKACVRKRAAKRREIAQKGRKFGIEIEFQLTGAGYYGNDRVDAEVVEDALEEAGIACRNSGYSHDVIEDSWKIVSDASIESGWELVSPPLFWQDREQVHTVCQVLEDLGAVADRSCGLHVHHEVTDLNVAQFKRLVRNWADAQNLTDLLVDAHRCGRNSEWSRAFNSRELALFDRFETLMQVRNSYLDRYKALNTAAYSQYGTVEIRQHQGTLEAHVILAWVAYGQAVIQAAASRKRTSKASVCEYLDTLPFKCNYSREILKQRERQPRGRAMATA